MSRIVLTTALLAFCSVTISHAEEKSSETREDQLKDLTLKVPGSWKQLPQKSSMRLATYEIPAVEDDPEAAELAIYNFPGGGGPVEGNIRRWIGQFDSKERQQKVTVGNINGKPYYVVEVSGTYNKPIGPPIRRQTKPVEGSRMLAVILQLEKGVYYLKLTGHDSTVKAQSTSLRTAFGGDAESEKEHKG